MRKKRIFLGLCVVIIIICMIKPDRKQQTIKRVKRNLKTYTKVVEQILESEIDTKDITLKGARDLSIWDSVQIDFTCNYGGFASSSSYSGFYYSVDDIPRAFQGCEAEFEKYKKGLKWQELEGDNWYYFEMHF